MKTFLIKLFSLVCAAVFIFESMVLFAVRYGRILPKDAISFYTFVLRTPRALDATLGFAIGFLCAGLIFLSVAFRRTRKQKIILIKENGETLRIPMDVVKDFISQILGQNRHMSEFDTKIHNKRKWLFIDIFPVFNNDVAVRQQVNQMREDLKEQIEYAFELNRCKVNFQLKGINAATAKKETTGTEDQGEKEEISLDKHVPAEIDTELQDDNIVEEHPLQEEKKPNKKRPWSLLYR